MSTIHIKAYRDEMTKAKKMVEHAIVIAQSNLTGIKTEMGVEANKETGFITEVKADIQKLKDLAEKLKYFTSYF